LAGIHLQSKERFPTSGNDRDLIIEHHIENTSFQRIRHGERVQGKCAADMQKIADEKSIILTAKARYGKNFKKGEL